mmetsp:Transcript_39927/g.82137  ORF Transcript_39927/g.82137 Transcript_39927/m.82137 type:complete len:200 (+) Transcript_39927:653-1252(+)
MPPFSYCRLLYYVASMYYRHCSTTICPVCLSCGSHVKTRRFPYYYILIAPCYITYLEICGCYIEACTHLRIASRRGLSLNVINNLFAFLLSQYMMSASLTILGKGHGEQFHLFGTGYGAIHGLGQDLDGETEGFGNIWDANLFLCRVLLGFHFLGGIVVVIRLGLGTILSLEERLAGLVVGTNHGSLPSGVIARRITLV